MYGRAKQDRINQKLLSKNKDLRAENKKLNDENNSMKLRTDSQNTFSLQPCSNNVLSYSTKEILREKLLKRYDANHISL